MKILYKINIPNLLMKSPRKKSTLVIFVIAEPCLLLCLWRRADSKLLRDAGVLGSGVWILDRSLFPSAEDCGYLARELWCLDTLPPSFMNMSDLREWAFALVFLDFALVLRYFEL